MDLIPPPFFFYSFFFFILDSQTIGPQYVWPPRPLHPPPPELFRLLAPIDLDLYMNLMNFQV